VLGLGNPVLSDDAAGLRVAARLQQRLQADPVDGVTVVTSTRAGFELIDLLTGATRAIIIDSLDMPDGEPGRVQRLEIHEVAGSARLVGAHELNLATALQLAADMGIPMPETIDVFGVEVAEIRQLGEHLTPAVEAAAERLSRDLHTLLKERART
jgi:hydrogenase maturation protease